MSVMYEHERQARTTSRLQHTHNKGWRCATESLWTLWHTSGSLQRTTTVHRCPNREGRGWPATTSTKTTTDKRPQDTDKRQDKRAFRKQLQTDTCKLTAFVVLPCCRLAVFFLSLAWTFPLCASCFALQQGPIFSLERCRQVNKVTMVLVRTRA